MSDRNIRRYLRSNCVVFRKTAEEFGGLSNMAPGFPLFINGTELLTSEALYQALRFPHLPNVQRLILNERSPMTAKMRSKPYRSDSRPDWDTVRVPIMRFCIRLKLYQNPERFGKLLLRTAKHDIVEESRRDNFWGALPIEGDLLEGQNVLGRLLMELRDKFATRALSGELAMTVPRISSLVLFDLPILVSSFYKNTVSDSFDLAR